MWYEWLGILVASLTPIVTVMLHLHGRASKAREEFRAEIESQMAGMSAQTRRDHEAVRVQITDLMKSVSGEYIRTREFESAIHGVNEQITQARREIGAVGNQVSEVTRRVDRIIDSRARRED